MTVNTAALRPYAWDGLARLGAKEDGGYVVPGQLVARAGALLSFGLSYDWTFERAFRKLNSAAPIHCYDPSISGNSAVIYSLTETIRGVTKRRGDMLKHAFVWMDYRAFFRGDVRHFEQKIARESGGGDATIAEAIARLDDARPIFLKMDIEGSEYRVLRDVLTYADDIEVMAIEFHELDLLADRFNALIGDLNKRFRIVHVHGNNFAGLTPEGFPNSLEITFVNKDAFAHEASPISAKYPIAGLDMPNNPKLPDCVMAL